MRLLLVKSSCTVLLSTLLLSVAPAVAYGVLSVVPCLCSAVCCCLLLQDLDELEQEVDSLLPDGGMDCDCGLDTGEELIEARKGMLAVSSQALLST